MKSVHISLSIVAALVLGNGAGCPKPTPTPTPAPVRKARPHRVAPRKATALTRAQAGKSLRGIFARLTSLKEGASVDLAKLLGKSITKLPAPCRVKAVVQVIPAPAVSSDSDNDEEKARSRKPPWLVLLTEPPDYNPCKSKVHHKAACVLSVVKVAGGYALKGATLKTKAAGKPLSTLERDVKSEGGCDFVTITNAGSTDCDREESPGAGENESEEKTIEIFSTVGGVLSEQATWTLRKAFGSDLGGRDGTGEVKWTTVGKSSLVIYSYKQIDKQVSQPSGKTTGTVTHQLEVNRITPKCKLDLVAGKELKKLRKLDTDGDIPQKPVDGDIGE